MSFAQFEQLCRYYMAECCKQRPLLALMQEYLTALLLFFLTGRGDEARSIKFAGVLPPQKMETVSTGPCTWAAAESLPAIWLVVTCLYELQHMTRVVWCRACTVLPAPHPARRGQDTAGRLQAHEWLHPRQGSCHLPPIWHGMLPLPAPHQVAAAVA